MPGTLASVSTLLTRLGGASVVPAISTVAAESLEASSAPATASTVPRRHGGATRGNGGRPADDLEERGLLAEQVLTRPGDHGDHAGSTSPCASNSRIASRSRSRSRVNVSFTATTIDGAPTARAAITAPSRTVYGL